MQIDFWSHLNFEDILQAGKEHYNRSCFKFSYHLDITECQADLWFRQAFTDNGSCAKQEEEKLISRSLINYYQLHKKGQASSKSVYFKYFSQFLPLTLPLRIFLNPKALNCYTRKPYTRGFFSSKPAAPSNVYHKHTHFAKRVELREKGSVFLPTFYHNFPMWCA